MKIKLNFDSSETRNLFLRYAVPCSSVLVRRGRISKRKLDVMVASVSVGRDVKNIESIFKHVLYNCQESEEEAH